MGVVHSSQGSFAPASPHLMSEPSIVANIAKTVLEPDAACDWSEMARNYDRIREHIEAVIPGFEQYNQRVRIPEGFYLPNGARKKIFNTASGKAQLTINPMPNRRVQPGHFILMTIRTHDQYNTTIYGMNDRYRGIVNERRVAFMNLNDMQQLGLSNHDIIHFKSYFKGATREAHYFKVVAYDIAQGCIATYFPETNCLVHLDNKAKESHTPASKFIEVEVIVANKK
jgi:anaerobic selenocysteine-containing dehydrogenase